MGGRQCYRLWPRVVASAVHVLNVPNAEMLCYAVGLLCLALRCGRGGKQREAVPTQQVKERADPRRPTGQWPGRRLAGKIIWRRREGGRVRVRRWVWFGLVWFWLLAGPGSGKVQGGAVRCGAGWLHAQAGNEPGWGLVPGRATRVLKQKPP